VSEPFEQFRSAYEGALVGLAASGRHDLVAGRDDKLPPHLWESLRVELSAVGARRPERSTPP